MQAELCQEMIFVEVKNISDVPQKFNVFLEREEFVSVISLVGFFSILLLFRGSGGVEQV